MNIKYPSIAIACVLGALSIVALPALAQQVASSTESTDPTEMPAPAPQQPMPILLLDSTSTRPMPTPPPERYQGASASSSGRMMSTSTSSVGSFRENPSRQLPPGADSNVYLSQPQQEDDIVVSSTDSPAVRLRKLARYWAVYREIGSQSMYAITVSGTKREIKTLDFFNKIESNFGMRLMPKGSLDQFTTGDAITSVDGLDLKSFRKLAEPCRLIKTADKPVVYLACLGIKRAIKNEQAFKQFGWDFKQVQSVKQGDVDQMKDGESVSESTVFDQGVTIEQPTNQQQQPMNQKPEIRKPSTPVAGTVKYDLVRLQGDAKLFVLGADGKLHRILNLEALRALRIDTSKIRVLTADQMKQYSEGEPMSAPAGAAGAQIRPTPMLAGSSTSTMPPQPAPQQPAPQIPAEQ